MTCIFPSRNKTWNHRVLSHFRIRKLFEKAETKHLKLVAHSVYEMQKRLPYEKLEALDTARAMKIVNIPIFVQKIQHFQQNVY